MGAVEFYHEIVSNNVTAAFNKLTDRAREEYGCDGYNGTISTCGLGTIRRIGNGFYTEDLDAVAQDYVEERNGGRKRVADVLDLGIVSYDVIKISKKSGGALTAKYLMKHAVCDWEGKVVLYKDTKKEAEMEAERLVMEACKKGMLEEYTVKKMHVNVNRGNNIESEFFSKNIYTVQAQFGKFEKPKTKKGEIVVENHMYVFYGFAAE